MRVIIGPIVAAMVLYAGIGVAGAHAQDQGPSANGGAIPRTPPDKGTLIPQQQPQSGSSAVPGSLSDQLNHSGGLIQPPPTTDDSVVAPPNQGEARTLVIPPPGTPGGDAAVQPK